MQLYRVKSKTRIPFRDCGNISNLKNNFMSKVLKYTKMYYEPPLQPKHTVFVVFMDQVLLETFIVLHSNEVFAA